MLNVTCSRLRAASTTLSKYHHHRTPATPQHLAGFCHIRPRALLLNLADFLFTCLALFDTISLSLVSTSWTMDLGRKLLNPPTCFIGGLSLRVYFSI